jgi:hypothetical protein
MQVLLQCCCQHPDYTGNFDILMYITKEDEANTLQLGVKYTEQFFKEKAETLTSFTILCQKVCEQYRVNIWHKCSSTYLLHLPL